MSVMLWNEERPHCFVCVSWARRQSAIRCCVCLKRLLVNTAMCCFTLDWLVDVRFCFWCIRLISDHNQKWINNHSAQSIRYKSDGQLFYTCVRGVHSICVYHFGSRHFTGFFHKWIKRANAYKCTRAYLTIFVTIHHIIHIKLQMVRDDNEQIRSLRKTDGAMALPTINAHGMDFST